MYLFLDHSKIRLEHFLQNTEPYTQHVLINHWLNVEYVSFLATDFAATSPISPEDQIDVRREGGISRVEQEREGTAVTLCQVAQASLPHHFEAV